MTSEEDFSYDYQTLFTDLEKKGQKYALITGGTMSRQVYRSNR